MDWGTSLQRVLLGTRFRCPAVPRGLSEGDEACASLLELAHCRWEWRQIMRIRAPGGGLGRSHLWQVEACGEGLPAETERCRPCGPEAAGDGLQAGGPGRSGQTPPNPWWPTPRRGRAGEGKPGQMGWRGL